MMDFARLLGRLRSHPRQRRVDSFTLEEGRNINAEKARENTARASRRDTEWLDGLRGVAALLVFFTHFSFSYWYKTRFVYGTNIPPGTKTWKGEWFPYMAANENGTMVIGNGSQDNHSVLQLPILRLIAYGEPMVVIFFIVSGYSLSLKPLSLVRSRQHTKYMSHLASSIFRRPIRLLLPVIVSTLLVAIAAGLGVSRHAASIANYTTDEDFHELFGGWAHEWSAPQKDSLWLQLKDWFFSLTPLMDFFTHNQWPASSYDNHLWTIPVEFRCSMFLFLTHAATALFTARVRLAIVIVFAIGGLTWGDTWEMCAFWAGMALCEINMVCPPSDRESHADRSRIWVRRSSLAAVLLSGLFLMSMPRAYARYTPFYAGLARYHIPGLRMDNQSRFWQCLGCIMVAAAISRTMALKQVFSSRICRYLGRISFALYIVHGPICRSLGYSSAVKFWEWFGHDTDAVYNFSVACTALLVFPTTFAISHLFCIYIDEPIVRAARTLDAKLRSHAEVQHVEWRTLPLDEPSDNISWKDGSHDSQFDTLGRVIPH